MVPTLIIGFKSDLLVPIESQRFLANHLPNANFWEIDSTYGHDGFLMEHQKITSAIQEFNKNLRTKKRSIVKIWRNLLVGKVDR